jgi:NAD+ kinase
MEYLQKFNISCFVTERVLEMVKEYVEEATDNAEIDPTLEDKVPKLDLDRVEIITDSNQNKINRVITLGGDGTVVQCIKLFYKDKCPKMITFSEESIGYLCCFESSSYEEVLYHSLIKIAPDREEFEVPNTFDDNDPNFKTPYVEIRQRVVLKVNFGDLDTSVKSTFDPNKKKKPKFGSLYSLNQITIDRGSYNYLTNIECSINDHPLTMIQGDGVIISSPTGSTAYNMSAGGSIVYNYVNCMLLTPICPHSLSFRPLILPDDCKVTFKASPNSRADHYNVSLDGDHMFKLKRGQQIDIHGSMCTLPFVTFETKDPLEEWCKRLNDSLHWNSRPVQKTFAKEK